MARETGSRDPGEGRESTSRETTSRERDEGRESTGLTSRRWRSPGVGAGGSPFGLMRRVAEDMDRLFDDIGLSRSGTWSPALFDRDLWSAGRDLEQVWAPQVETFRRGDQIVVRADLPGMKKENVNVEIENDVLKISGERREEHEEKRDEYFRSERSYGRFYRAIPLPEGASDEQCNATFNDGVLEVTLAAPKEQQQRGKRIDIK